MAFSGNEVTAANEQRRNAELSKSPAGEMIATGISIAGPATALGTSLAAHGSIGLAIAGSVVAGLGIVEWIRKLGSSKVHENLDALGQATEDALNRVENILKEHGIAIGEIKKRLDSDDFKNAMASASLQALRTTQLDRFKRLALILANSVKADDLEPESVDDMMRAAVELNESDILFLTKIYQSQILSLRDTKLTDAARLEQMTMQWPNQQPARVGRATIISAHRGSVARLQACAFVQFRTPGAGSGGELAFLLGDGAKFYERLQEIGTTK